MKTLSSALAWWARTLPDTSAIVFSGEPLSYAEYHAWSNRVAAWLRDNGLAPGERVAVCATNSLNYCVLALGIIRAGGIVAPMNARFTRPELAELVAGVTPRLIFADAECKLRVDDLGPPVLDLAQVQML